MFYIGGRVLTHMTDQDWQTKAISAWNEGSWDTSILTTTEMYFCCRAINHYGSDMHAWVTPKNLRYYNPTYVKDCVLLIPEDALSPDGVDLRHIILAKMEDKT